jgi:hypothetical protein
MSSTKLPLLYFIPLMSTGIRHRKRSLLTKGKSIAATEKRSNSRKCDGFFDRRELIKLTDYSTLPSSSLILHFAVVVTFVPMYATSQVRPSYILIHGRAS